MSLSLSLQNPAAQPVQKARAQAVEWASLTVGERCERLKRWHALIAEEAGLLAQTITDEIGKPLQEAYGADVMPSLDALNWLCRTAPRHLKKRSIRGGSCLPMPYGVIGVIGTWNYPAFLNVTPIAWALASGNAVIWKPSEWAEKTAQVLEAQFEKIGLPVTVVYGGSETGQQLCRAGIDKLCFTGGVLTGRAILKTLAETGTPSVMELSGNDALLVLEDADLSLAAKSAVWGRCCNAGQSCVAPGRILVHFSRYNEFLSLCQKEIGLLRRGIELSPLRTEKLRDRVEAVVCDSVKQGARLLAGGSPSEENDRFYPPTLLADCTEAMPAFSEEFFGPVLAVSSFESNAEAVVCANSGETALAASVFTGDRAQGERIAAQLEAGLVSINEVLLDAASPEIPFGGFRASGFGKQRGVAGLEEFVVLKTVTFRPERKLRRHLFPYFAETPEILDALIQLKNAKHFKAKLKAAGALTRAVMKSREH